MGTKVKDKIFYMSEHLGVPKSWVPKMLDVSDTTLTKWSYNPLNVSEEMSERIFLRIAILEALDISFKKCVAYIHEPGSGLPIPKHYWTVKVGGDVYCLADIRRRLPRILRIRRARYTRSCRNKSWSKSQRCTVDWFPQTIK